MYIVIDFLVYIDFFLRRKVGILVELIRSCSMWGVSLWLNWDCRSGGVGKEVLEKIFLGGILIFIKILLMYVISVI